ncbi:MAG: flagellin FliC [Bdellovibrionales bacterium]|nr:flagellin FliC [Bdellovibrionales bacterium]
MGLRINTNVPSLVAQRNLRSNRQVLDRTLERLSSGSRINHAGDDAAGLAISETLRAQIRGLSQAERNAQDGISLVQVAEGGLVEVSNILIRMRELGVQAASDTVGPKERKFLDNEFQQLAEEIDRIANSIEFNGNPLLNGSGSAFEVQIGTKNNPLVDRIKLFDPYSSNVNLVSLGINLSTVGDKTSAQNSLASIDDALNAVTSIRAGFGSMQNRLQSVINNLQVNKENMMSANSRIRDADLAEETSELTKSQILNQAGVSVLSQANSSIKSALGLLGGQA